MKRRGKKRGSRSFNPDEFVADIHRCLHRDLGHLVLDDPAGSPQSALAYSVLGEFRKKYASPYVDQSPLEEKAFNLFRGINAHVGATTLDLGPSERTHPSKMSEIHLIHARAKAIVAFVLGGIDDETVYLHCKNSGGVTLGVGFADTSWDEKFRFPISATTGVLPTVRDYLSWDAMLKKTIEDINGPLPVREEVEVVAGSRATTVEKNDTIRRMIAVEPTWNMWFQQGLMGLLYKRLRAVGLDVERLPDVHRRLAFESSLTGRNATIDFSSASDCVSIELLRWLLPPKWFDWLDRVRCPTMSLNGDVVKLNMISTMGNATTFPIETLVFWSYAHACRMSKKATYSLLPEWSELKECSVFGDDCILPTEIAPLFIQVCEDIGFLVNDDKSFYSDEPFRESCGGDFLHGHEVRPFHVRAPQSTRVSSLEPWMYVVWNDLLKKYIQCFGGLTYIYDKELFRFFESIFTKYKLQLKLVPSDYPNDSGLYLSQDWERLKRHYPRFRLGHISVNAHGVYRFKVCKFQYRNKRALSDALRYADWLRRPIRAARTEEQDPRWGNVRRIGGYVVAYSETSRWLVPGKTGGDPSP